LVELSAFFVNPFEQGDAFHPGLIDVSADLFRHLGLTLDIPRMLTDTRTTIFCNYFVANARFWRAWCDIAEKMFAICEHGDSDLARRLNAQSGHGREQVPMKVFVLERIATVLLATDPSFRASFYCPFDLPRAGLGFADFPDEAVICDALKIAYQTQR